jgi:valacyclovir hydrolase
MPRARLPGVDLHCEDRGTGEVLLCIPGALGTGITDFGPQLDGLSGSFRVIAPDLRGYGRSRPPRRDFPPDFLERDAADLEALLGRMGVASCSVAGWSDGANVAALLAIRNPALVRRLVLWGGNSFVSAEDAELYERTRSIATWSPRMRESLEAVYGDELQALWSAWGDWMQGRLAAGGELYRRRLGEIRCPALILHGARDPLVPGFHPEALREGIAGARMYLYPEGKHNIHLKYAPEFNRMVDEFCR